MEILIAHVKEHYPEATLSAKAAGPAAQASAPVKPSPAPAKIEEVKKTNANPFAKEVKNEPIKSSPFGAK
jgi:hypothetical protein